MDSPGPSISWASFNPAISADGGHVAFNSRGPHLVPDDTNNAFDIFVHDRQTRATERVSVASDGSEGNGDSLFPAISADGRYVAFDSEASELVRDDENGDWDVFVHDRHTGTTERVSLASDGSEGNNDSFFAAISADGRHVAFESDASNLVPDDANGHRDVFVHDRETETTERVSVASDGSEGNGHSLLPAISGDGRHIAFFSLASNLVPGDTNNAFDVFVHDRQTGTTERVSVASDGSQGNDHSGFPRISGDGRHVAFESGASNLVPSDTNNAFDVFVHDRQTGITERVSVASDGSEGNSDSFFAAISADGSHVAYGSEASNLVPGDGNDLRDIFVHNRETRATERVSVSSTDAEGNGHSDTAATGADGRLVAFTSFASNLVPGDTNNTWDVFVRDRGPTTGVSALRAQRKATEVAVSGKATFSGVSMTAGEDPANDGVDPIGAEITEAALISRPEVEDLLVRIRLASLPSTGPPGIVYGFEFTAGQGRYQIRGAARAGNPFFALYRCDVLCLKESELQGSYGTTGQEVLVGLPEEISPAGPGDLLSEVRAFTATGDAETGPVEDLDEIHLPDAVIPATRVEVGIAAAGTPEQEVGFEAADLAEGRFSGSLDTSELPAGNYDVWARACLDETCGASSASVNLAAGPTPSPSPSPTVSPAPEPTESPDPPPPTFTVNSTGDAGVADTGDGSCDTGDQVDRDGTFEPECTLRAAIEQANADAGEDRIAFDIPGTGPYTIRPNSALPVLIEPTIIDGYTQPGASPATGTTTAALMIELDGTNTGAGVDGFQINTSDSTIRGLVINRTARDGVRIAPGSTRNTIEGNYIGTDVGGTADLGTSFHGVLISGASSNTVGGTTAAQRNVISGNGQGIRIEGAAATGNVVSGNFMGTDATGVSALGAFARGIFISGAPSNTVGGKTAGERNVISGNGSDGIVISGAAATGNVVSGNFIGTDNSGIRDLGNGGSGIVISGAPSNIVGGKSAGERNVISGNDSNGVLIQGIQATGNVVWGNFIGTDRSGSRELGNNLSGALISGAPSNTVGGKIAGERNVISGNDVDGIRIFGAGARENAVSGNFIGTDESGAEALPNGFRGVFIEGAPSNTVGGNTADERNVISGNRIGVLILGAQASENTVSGNFIGTDVAGTVALGNGNFGVSINSAPSNTVGGDDAAVRNLISGNGSHGIRIAGSSATKNAVSGNFIGTNASGSLGLGNAQDGIRIQSNAPENTIGGTAAGTANLIASNQGNGVTIMGPSATSNTISANSIFGNGLLGIDLGNDGVTPNDADDTDVGPNSFQNFPVIDATESTSSSTTVSGRLTSRPEGGFTLEFFDNEICDPSGFGEGQEFLGAVEITTDDEGSASFTQSFPTPMAGGGFVTATATSDSGDTSEFSACAEVPPDEPEPEVTEVAFTERSQTSGQYSDETLFEARLIDSDGAPIAGEELIFELTGEESSRHFTDVTDEDGIASVTPTLTEKPGPYQLTVRYHGDDDRAPAADTIPFVVEKKDTATRLTVQGGGNNMMLRARLSHLGSPSDRVEGRTIDFYSDGELIGSEQTDSDGVATVPVPPGHRGANRTYEAVFEGDDFYAPSSDKRLGRGGGPDDADGPTDQPSWPSGGAVRIR